MGQDTGGIHVPDNWERSPLPPARLAKPVRWRRVWLIALVVAVALGAWAWRGLRHDPEQELTQAGTHWFVFDQAALIQPSTAFEKSITDRLFDPQDPAKSSTARASIQLAKNHTGRMVEAKATTRFTWRKVQSHLVVTLPDPGGGTHEETWYLAWVENKLADQKYAGYSVRLHPDGANLFYLLHQKTGLFK
ncbi:hypothetical protein [Lacticaseibacillus parakribbianus]|uniref:hypothetical protein n=1 Tax=Lacticaseibacillus parakribbianus TaxID=2970927 RepID=UPI0021CB723C|nr:hypothetical protein [Lacticaseibacillus parakribbianus]